MACLKVLLCSQPKYIQFTVIEEERKVKIFTFKRMQSENIQLLFFLKKKHSEQLIEWHNSW